MSNLEIFQNGVSLHPDTMGEPIYQIGTKNADGGYDVVVSDPMGKKEAKARLAEMQPSKPEPKPVAKKGAAKKTAKKTAKKKKKKG
tara:strand:- start:2608 stop:2865 length:258 start_codon:yes stop_codon:yes gene_type:complete